jgi:amidohydrolase
MIRERIQELSDRFYPDMVRIRHDLHAHPELGFEEHRTSRLVAETLGALGLEVRTQVARTGVLGLLRGTGAGPAVLLRADMDALPIQEEVDLPYRSRVANRMHACGHDGHVAGLLGAAMILAELRGEFPGLVKLAFQPAEETSGGAQGMIDAGVLADPPVAAAFAAHLWGSVPEGRVELRPGPMMASVDDFRLRIIGRGGHGGMPHLAVDPVVAGAQVILALQTIVSRRQNPVEPAVVSVTMVHGGDAENVIPGSVDLGGTIRVLSADSQKRVFREIETIVKGVCQASGAEYQLEFRKLFPPLRNDPEMAVRMGRAFAKVVGETQVSLAGQPVLASEDFSFFAEHVPSAFAFVGIAKDPAAPVPHHHPQFQWDDRNLLVLARGLAQTAMDFLLES